ncbi:MAG TPA: ATP-binding cassette domain-containing protein, partial [Pseudobdellovibrionaceae bacterium]|nr:ATP-binding cassette domain-containing protein [Pseudobdellovibrionaceae bacterium]
MSDTILEVQNLCKHFISKSGLINKTTQVVRAVDGINLSLRKGESFGLVGESGCGKSTLGRTIIQLYTPTSGSIRFHGKDLTHLSANELRSERKRIQMIFQDPYSSLDPRMTIGQALAEPFQIHGLLGPKEREARIKNLLELVSLRPSVVNRYPHEFSGGQRQRIAVARALALEPELIICDEPVSALDVSIQAQILNLLKDLQERLKLTYLFISHDLSVIEYFCDRIAVMYLGRIVEMADREELFARSNHPYTRALIKAVPEIGGGKKMMKKALA